MSSSSRLNAKLINTVLALAVLGAGGFAGLQFKTNKDLLKKEASANSAFTQIDEKAKMLTGLNIPNGPVDQRATFESAKDTLSKIEGITVSDEKSEPDAKFGAVVHSAKITLEYASVMQILPKVKEAGWAITGLEKLDAKISANIRFTEGAAK